MSNLFAPSLNGDGINFAFFDNVWSNNRNSGNQKQSKDHGSKRKANVSISVPDTVIFQLGQPLQWYFTSDRGRQPTILRKKKQNLTAEKVEEEFLRKARKDKKGPVEPTDIIAYFIASKECTIRNRQQQSSKIGDVPNSWNTDSDDENGDASCDIQYLNKEGLHDFLKHDKRKNQTGILQRFLQPCGCTAHNSQIRAICTPNVCHLDRRRTKEHLHDTRFGLYERAMTFDGPDVHSISLPIKGTVLATNVKSICDKVLSHVSKSFESNNKARNGDKEIVRMVLNLKVDSNDRLWVLYSSSIQSLQVETQPPIWKDITGQHFTEIDPSKILTIDPVIKLPPTVKLRQNANHDQKIEQTQLNELRRTCCPSCAEVESWDRCYPVSYKAIITHFEKVMTMVNDSGTGWPPLPEIIKCAGGVGFGTITKNEKDKYGFDDDFNFERKPEDGVIPPVIKFLHKKLMVGGYQRYRTDYLFLHRQCMVCETCFLSYAKLASTSFQIVKPFIHVNGDHAEDFYLPHRSLFDSIGSSTNRKPLLDLKPTPSFKPLKSSENILKKKNKRDAISRHKSQEQSVSSSDNDENNTAVHDPDLIPINLDSLESKIGSYDEGMKKEDEPLLKSKMPTTIDALNEATEPLNHIVEAHEELQGRESHDETTPLMKDDVFKVSHPSPYAVPLKIVQRSSMSDKMKKRKENAIRDPKKLVGGQSKSIFDDDSDKKEGLQVLPKKVRSSYSVKKQQEPIKKEGNKSKSEPKKEEKKSKTIYPALPSSKPSLPPTENISRKPKPIRVRATSTTKEREPNDIEMKILSEALEDMYEEERKRLNAIEVT